MAAVLLTGASGYLGAAIGAALRHAGVACDGSAGRLEQLPPASLGPYRKVIHTAAALRLRSPDEIDRSNRIGTARLLAALRGAPEILYISSHSVYGRRPGESCVEDDAPQPADDYARSKLAGEQALNASGRPHCILRVSRLIGDSPAGIGYGFHAEAIRGMLAGRTVTRYTPDRLDDSLDVRALAVLCAGWAADTSPLAPGVWNVCGPARSLHRLLDDFAAAAIESGARPRIEDQPGPPSPLPLMSNHRLRAAGAAPAQRSDREIGRACCARLRN